MLRTTVLNPERFRLRKLLRAMAGISRFFLATMLCVVSARAAADVLIAGLEPRLRDNVLAHMRLDEESCDENPERIRFRFGTAETQIRRALEPFGHYRPLIAGDLEFPAGSCWLATFTIDPGERVVITSLDVDVIGAGATETVFRETLDGSELKIGKPLKHQHYDALKSRLALDARELGYFDAAFAQQQLRVFPPELSAEIALVLDTGVRYRFGDLNVAATSLDPKFIERFIDFQRGAPYQQSAIRRLRADLSRNGYFDSVNIVTTSQPDSTVDVSVTLSEGRRWAYGIGFGIGTDTGPVVRTDVTNRRINRRGHSLELDTELSEVEQNVTAEYRIPGKRPQRDWYSIYGGLSWRNTDAIRSRTRKIGVRETRFHSSRWRSNRFIEYAEEEFKIDGAWEQANTLVPGYTLIFQAANDIERPTSGIRLGVEALGASDSLLSDSTFVRLRAFGKTILPVAERGRILLRGDYGYTLTDDFESVPPSWRFYAGGDASVRGYAYESLGPVDNSGNALGGERIITGSLELDWRLTDNWSAAVFTDAGTVGDDNLLQNIPWSVGAGVRWYSPLGPIRVDFAFPQRQKDGYRLHLSMGPDL